MFFALGNRTHAVKKIKFSGQQIAFALKQSELFVRCLRVVRNVALAAWVQESMARDASALILRIKEIATISTTRVLCGCR